MTSRLLSPLIEPRTWTRTAYLLLTGVTGLLWFLVLAFGVSFGLAFLLLWVGAALLAVLPLLWRAGARTERHLIGALLDVHIEEPYRLLPPGSLFARARGLAGDPATWKDLAYLLLLFPMGTFWSALVVTFWGWGLTLLTLPLYYWALPNGRVSWLGLGDLIPTVETLPAALIACLVGVALTLAAPQAVRAGGHLHGLFAQAMLGASARQELAKEASRMRLSRDRVVESAAAERRRLERDLHDGAQQRLISVAMGVGMARRNVSNDPDAAEDLLETAHSEIKQAIAELRDLARGLHPAMLAEQGLDAALSALAARSPVPVEVDIDLTTRPPQRIEEAAYFTVAEALTNAAKHADPDRVWVRITRRGRALHVEIGDDGTGGAVIIAGGGLAGLADRVAGVEGTMDLTSPRGGPSVVTVELPCE